MVEFALENDENVGPDDARRQRSASRSQGRAKVDTEVKTRTFSLSAAQQFVRSRGVKDRKRCMQILSAMCRDRSQVTTKMTVDGGGLEITGPGGATDAMHNSLAGAFGGQGALES